MRHSDPMCAKGGCGHVKKQRTIRITNRHIQNYLGERKIWPIEDWGDGPAIYLATEELRTALESYNIEFYCFRRK